MLLTWMLSVVGFHIANSVVAPASYVKKGGGGSHVAHLDIVHCSSIVSYHVTNSSVPST